MRTVMKNADEEVAKLGGKLGDEEVSAEHNEKTTGVKPNLPDVHKPHNIVPGH